MSPGDHHHSSSYSIARKKRKKSNGTIPLEKIFGSMVGVFLIGAFFNIHIVNEVEQSSLKSHNDNNIISNNNNNNNNNGHESHHDYHKMKALSTFANHHMRGRGRRHGRRKGNLPNFEQKGEQHYNDILKTIPHLERHQRILHSGILETIDKEKLRPYGAEAVWEDLLLRGQQIMEQTKEHLVVVEVGAQNEKQSLMAVKAKFHVHCVEPSPSSFENIKRNIMEALKDDSDGDNNETKKYVHLYNVAAGSESDQMLDFYATGGTGDHVGKIFQFFLPFNI